MFDVFISHSTKNKIIADALKHHLERAGVRCWKAPDNILPGQVWEVAITDAIRACQIMLLVWSSDSQESHQVQRELSVAANAGKVVIPYRIEDIQPVGLFEYYLTNTHWLDAYSQDIENALQEVVHRVSAILGAVEKSAKAHSNPNIAAKEQSNPSDFSAYQELLSILLPDIPLVTNQTAAQSLLDESIGLSRQVWPKIKSIGYITVPSPGKSLRHAKIYFCDKGIVISRSAAQPVFIEKNKKIDINSFRNELIIGLVSLKTKGIGKASLHRIASAMSTWIQCDHSVLSVIYSFVRKYSKYSIAADNFYPLCSGGLEEKCNDCDTIANTGLPLASFDQAFTADGFSEHFASITFYRDYISVASTFPDGVTRLSWRPCSQLISEGLQNWEEGNLVLRTFCELRSQSQLQQDNLTPQVLSQILIEWSELAASLPLQITAIKPINFLSSENTFTSSAEKKLSRENVGTILEDQDPKAGEIHDNQSCFVSTGEEKPSESKVSLINDELNSLLSLARIADAEDRPPWDKCFKDKDYFLKKPKELRKLLDKYRHADFPLCRHADLSIDQLYLFVDFRNPFDHFCGLVICKEFFMLKTTRCRGISRYDYVSDRGLLWLDLLATDDGKIYLSFERGDDDFDIYSTRLSSAAKVFCEDGQGVLTKPDKSRSFLEDSLPRIVRLLVELYRLRNLLAF